MVDTTTGTFLYLDPLQEHEYTVGDLLLNHFQDWLLSYKQSMPDVRHRTPLVLRVVNHAQQKDRRNCGIWTLWFAKRILQRAHIKKADVGKEGAMLAAEIMASSQPIHNLCIKCGNVFDAQKDTIKMCQGVCRPRKTFHVRCIPEKSRGNITFYCEVCDTTNRDDKCYDCGAAPDMDMSVCIAGDYSGCTRFIHKRCLPAGSSSYNCGICTLRVK